MIKYNYSLIKYMASASRQEVINVGIVIFRKQGIDVRILESSAKVRLIDGASEQDDLNDLKNNMKNFALCHPQQRNSLKYCPYLKEEHIFQA